MNYVERYCVPAGVRKTVVSSDGQTRVSVSVASCSGDFLKVNGTKLGATKDIADIEYQRCKRDHPENPAYFMRPMFFTGSLYGNEILKLIKERKTND